MIKIDMNMPECCMRCPFYIAYCGGTCLVDQYNSLYFGNMYVDMVRHSSCPLEEVEDDD